MQVTLCVPTAAQRVGGQAHEHMLMGLANEHMLMGLAHEHMQMGLAHEHVLMGLVHEHVLMEPDPGPHDLKSWFVQHIRTSGFEVAESKCIQIVGNVKYSIFQAVNSSETVCKQFFYRLGHLPDPQNQSNTSR